MIIVQIIILNLYCLAKAKLIYMLYFFDKIEATPLFFSCRKVKIIQQYNPSKLASLLI